MANNRFVILIIGFIIIAIVTYIIGFQQGSNIENLFLTKAFSEQQSKMLEQCILKDKVLGYWTNYNNSIYFRAISESSYIISIGEPEQECFKIAYAQKGDDIIGCQPRNIEITQTSFNGGPIISVLIMNCICWYK